MSTNATNTMHIFGIKGDDDVKRFAAFQVIKIVKYTCLELKSIYPSQNIKVICNKNIFKNLKQIFLAQSIFKKDQVRPADKFINVSTNMSHVKGVIAFMDNSGERKQISQLCDKKKFSFTYNKVNNKNPNSGYDFEEFCKTYKFAVKFTTHAINIKSVLKPDLIFNYNFRL